VLKKEEEAALVTWLKDLGDRGVPVTKEQLMESVHQIIKNTEKRTPFLNQRPGRHWYELFLKRHSDVALRTPQNLTSSRSQV
jgi:hypothetical protein